MLLPSIQYAQACCARTIHYDQSQAILLPILDRLVMTVQHKAPWPKALKEGCYIVGRVGRGKTWLMDATYRALKPYAIRWHWHAWLQSLHRDLERLKGVSNPVDRVLDEQLKGYRVLCLDEVLLEDIADAMLVRTIIDYTRRHQLYWIVTSNTLPLSLYEHGLQRSQIIGTLQYMHTHWHQLSLTQGVDYRKEFLVDHPGFIRTDDPDHLKRLTEWFNFFKGSASIKTDPLVVEGHTLYPERYAGKVVHFTFQALCQTYTSTRDYIALAERYPYWIISEVPRLTDGDASAVQRWIRLVDVLYDRQCTLLWSASVNRDAIYLGSQYAVAYARTQSRLQAMHHIRYTNNSA